MKFKFPTLLLFVFFVSTAFDGCEEDVVLGGATTDDNDSEASNQDRDADGLSDAVEELSSVGTLQATADTDQDGFSDGLEYAFNSGDPLNSRVSPGPENRARSLAPSAIITNDTDADGDGLGKDFEDNSNLDDNDADIDDDGYSDSVELLNGSNPFLSSSVPTRTQPPSGDGSLGNDPNGSDSDRDGLSDRIESFEGSDPLNRDTDGDGFDDGIEFLMGSSALDAQVVPNFSVPNPPATN